MSPDDFDRSRIAVRAEDDGQAAIENAKCGVSAMLRAFAQDRSFTMQDDILFRYLHTLEQDLEQVQKAHETLSAIVAGSVPLAAESISTAGLRPDRA